MTPKRYILCVFMPGLFAVLGPLIAKVTYNTIIEEDESENASEDE